MFHLLIVTVLFLAEWWFYRAIYRVLHEQLVLPEDMGAGVDDRLRSIVNRALLHDARQRYVGARVFQSELEQWASQSPASAEAQGSPSGQSSTLEFLLRRMRHEGDVPAMSESVLRKTLSA